MIMTIGLIIVYLLCGIVVLAWSVNNSVDFPPLWAIPLIIILWLPLLFIILPIFIIIGAICNELKGFIDCYKKGKEKS